MLAGLSTSELLIIFGIVVVPFGAGRIGKLAKEFGSGIREFRKGMEGVSAETPDE